MKKPIIQKYLPTDTQSIRYFGITPRQRAAILESQDYRCAICEKIMGEGLCLDHDHRTDNARGYLCRECNYALGFFRDRIISLQRAIDYLRRDPITPELEPSYRTKDCEKYCRRNPQMDPKYIPRPITEKLRHLRPVTENEQSLLDFAAEVFAREYLASKKSK